MIVKKLIAIAAAAVLFAGAAFGDEFIKFAIGARGNVNYGLGTSLPEEQQKALDQVTTIIEAFGGTVKKGVNLGGGFGVYGSIGFHIPFLEATIGVQPEFCMNFNNGYYYKASLTLLGTSGSVEAKLCTDTIDIPVLFFAEFDGGSNFAYGLGLGPQFSIPFNAKGVVASTSSSASDLSYSPSGMNVGFIIAGNGKILLGEHFALVGDLRWYTESTTKVTYTTPSGEKKTEEWFKRSNISVGLGTEIRF